MEAAKTSISFSEKGLKEGEKEFSRLGKTLSDAVDALERGDMTEQQFKQVVFAQPTPEEIHDTVKAYAGGAGQVLRERQPNALLDLLSRNAEKLTDLQVNDPKAYAYITSKGDLFDEKYVNTLKDYGIVPKETVTLTKEEAEKIGKANPEWLKDYAKNIDNPKWQKANRFAMGKARQAGVFNKLYYNTSHIAKNIALLVNFKNRAWDLGANFAQHGMSLSDIYIAEKLSGKARRAFARVMPSKKIRAALSMPDSHYAGEAAKNVVGMMNTVFDSIKQTADNMRRFVKNKNTDGYIITPIGKHNQRIDFGYGYENNIAIANSILPDDMLSIREFLSTDLTGKQKVGRAIKFSTSEAGYYGAKQPDVFASGSFRGGYIRSESWAKANELVGNLPDDVVERMGGKKKALDDTMNMFIALDDGQPLSKDQQSMSDILFGVGERGEKRRARAIKNLADNASEQAASDVYRAGGNRTLPGKISMSFDRNISRIPVVGKIYDACFPLVRTTMRAVDSAISYNPFSAGLNVIKDIKEASRAIERGFKPNMRKVDRAIGKFATGAMLYAGAYELISNKIITGKHNLSERRALINAGIKEDSLFIGGKSFSYKRLGGAGEILSLVANIFNDIRDINENYEDPSNTYNTLDASISMIGLLADGMAKRPERRLNRRGRCPLRYGRNCFSEDRSGSGK